MLKASAAIADGGGRPITPQRSVPDLQPATMTTPSHTAGSVWRSYSMTLRIGTGNLCTSPIRCDSLGPSTRGVRRRAGRLPGVAIASMLSMSSAVGVSPRGTSGRGTTSVASGVSRRSFPTYRDHRTLTSPGARVRHLGPMPDSDTSARSGAPGARRCAPGADSLGAPVAVGVADW